MAEVSMDRYIGVFIGIDTYKDSKFHRVGHAVDDATKTREAFLKLGCPEDRLTLIVDGNATYSTLTSAIKRVCKLAVDGDVVVIFFAGHGLNQDGKNYLLCQDTDHSYIPTTALAQDLITEELSKCVSTRKMVFLDACHSGAPIRSGERDAKSSFSIDDLRYLTRDVKYSAVFSSCQDDEKSLTDFARKHGVWTYYLLQALTGKVAKLYEQDLLFSDKLQAYLMEQTRQRSYEISDSKTPHTPILLSVSNDRFPVADLRSLFLSLSVEASGVGIPITQSLLIRREEELVSKLPGWNPLSHFAPARGSAEGLKFIKKLGTPLVETELGRIREVLKTGFGYARKDMPTEVAVIDGTGTLSTRDFDYTISIEHSSTDSTKYVLVHTIHNLKSLQMLEDERFNVVFDRLEEFVVKLPRKCDVRELIDAFEEIDSPPFKVDYDKIDFEQCEITFTKTGHSIVFTPTTMTFKPFLRTSTMKIVEGYKSSIGMLQGRSVAALIAGA